MVKKNISRYCPFKETTVIDWNRSGRKVQLRPGKQTAKHGLLWRNINKTSQIIKDYFYLPLFLLIILCLSSSQKSLLHAQSNFLKTPTAPPSQFYLSHNHLSFPIICTFCNLSLWRSMFQGPGADQDIVRAGGAVGSLGTPALWLDGRN